MINESQMGTTITCPDCHSAIEVSTANAKPSQHHHSTDTSKGESQGSSFDPAAPLELESTFERPAVYPDLPDSDDPPTANEAADATALAPAGKAKSNDRADDPELNSGTANRSEMRKRARKRRLKERKRRKQSVADDRSSEDQPRFGSLTSRRRRRRARKTNLFAESLGWSKFPSLLIVSLIAGGLLSFSDSGQLTAGPLDIFNRWFTAITTEQPISAWLVSRTAAFGIGSMLLYFVAGRSFALRVRPIASEDATDPKRPGSFRTSIQFAVAWLLSGLPFLWLHVLTIPLQIAIFPALLAGLWRNGSWWQVIAADGFAAPQTPSQKRVRRKKRKDQNAKRPSFFRPLLSQSTTAAAASLFTTAMIFSGGFLVVPGWLLTAGIVIGTAGICGGHCRKIAKQLEPPK